MSKTRSLPARPAEMLAERTDRVFIILVRLSNEGPARWGRAYLSRWALLTPVYREAPTPGGWSR